MRYLIVLMLSGCALTPTALRREGHLVEASSAAPPTSVTQCIVRNALETGIPLSAMPEPEGGTGVSELHAIGPMYIVRVEPASAGSRISIRYQPILLPIEIDRFITPITKGC